MELRQLRRSPNESDSREAPRLATLPRRMPRGRNAGPGWRPGRSRCEPCAGNQRRCVDFFERASSARARGPLAWARTRRRENFHVEHSEPECSRIRKQLVPTCDPVVERYRSCARLKRSKTLKAFHEPLGDKPTPDPSQEGNRTRRAAPLLGGAGGGFMVPMHSIKVVEALYE